MCNHKNALTGKNISCNVVVPEWQYSRDAVLQAFGKGHHVGGEILVHGIMSGPSFVGLLESGGWEVVAPAPDEYLLFAMLLGGLGFVKSLEGTVVTLV
jgi:hypothetical protein